MTAIAAIQADLQVSTLGTRSRLAHRLAGKAILRRTVERACAVGGIERVLVAAPPAQVASCRDILTGLTAEVVSVDYDEPPWRRLVQSSRKWSLDGWRGGVGGSTVFDEFTDCRVLAALLEETRADAVWSLPPGAPLLSIDLAEMMIHHHAANREQSRITFTQAIPGLAGIMLDASLVRELVAPPIPLSWLFSYKPDQPEKDLIFQPACVEVPAPLRFASGRLMADTDSSMRLLETMLERQEEWTLAELGAFLVEQDERGVEPFPREIEIELTTLDPFPNNMLSPRGEQLGRCGILDPKLIRKIAGEMVEFDDTLCVLGGFGDPLEHPQFGEVLESLHPLQGTSRRHVLGLCVRTNAAKLTRLVAQSLIDHQVDVLGISLDAWSDPLYATVKGPGPSQQGLSDVKRRIDDLASLQQETKSPTPILVAEMIKSKINVHELDEFFDGWLRRVGAVHISGYSNFAGQRENQAVMDMRPPIQTPCRRLRSRCLVLCDGRVALCDQDYKGLHTFGNVRDKSIAEIWQSPALQEVRRSHLDGNFERHPLCAKCSEWHRP